VRVVSVGDWARELCGGTHAQRSSQLGVVKLLGESSIGSGVRRVEALVGADAYSIPGARARHRRPAHRCPQGRPEELPERVASIVEKLRVAEKEIEKVRTQQLLAASGELAQDAAQLGPIKVVAHRADGAGGAEARQLAMDVRGKLPQGEPGVVVIVGVADGKAAIVTATNDLARERGVKAGELLRAIAPVLNGKGGGKDDMAQGGGSDVSRVDEALELARTEIGRVVGA
jgi:alanyl-tRNA synthetase